MPPDSRPPNREAPSPAVGPADQSKHMPDERERRQGKALCLSGGGYRAALFHLGALRRLNELGILSQLDTVTSSSGGSIMSAILADRVQPWPDPGQEFGDWEAKVAVPLREFITHDIRTGPILARLLLPWNWFRISAQAEELARLYYRHLTKQKVLDLPPRPRFVFCATDVVFGANWVCERERMGDYQYGYTTPPEALRVAEAVAASSCCPPMFDPLRSPRRPCDYVGGKCHGPGYDKYRRAVRLTDSGVYDNMATEPVWKDHAVVLVSDAGSQFRFATSTNPIGLLLRYQSLIGRQSAALRKRWLISNFIKGVLDGAYWGIGSDVATYPTHPPRYYPSELVSKVISRVRTDLASMSKAEIAVLENQGYLTADAAARSHVPELIPNVFKSRSVAVPHPYYMDECLVERELRGSARFRLFGRRG